MHHSEGMPHRINDFSAPTFRQIVPAQKNMPRLLKSSVGGVINIIEQVRTRRAVWREQEWGGVDGHGGRAEVEKGGECTIRRLR